MSKPIILCVDDETIILNSLKIQLRNAFQDTYLYEEAENADEAMEIIEEVAEDGFSIVVIVSDWLMPGLKGDEFLIQVHQKYPQVVKIMLTGQADETAINRAKKHANLHCCLPKPWSEADLIKSIKTSLGM